jgi:hypothetical protein
MLDKNRGTVGLTRSGFNRTGAVVLLTGALAIAWSGCQKPEDEITVGGSGGAINATDGTGGAIGSGGAIEPEGSGGSVAPDDAGSDVAEGSGGAGPEMADAAPMNDVAPVVDVQPIEDVAPVSDVVEVPTTPPLMECATPSIHRLQEWRVASEATAMTTPASGSVLVKQDSGYVARATFGTGKWHAVSVWVANVLDAQTDLGAYAGLTVTYGATAPVYLQMRAASNYNTGDHYVVQLPSTAGALQSVFIPLSADRWAALARLGTPKMPFADLVKQVRAFFFVGDVPNTLTVTGFLIDGYVPPCK